MYKLNFNSLFIISLFKISWACNGYELKVNHARNCVDDPIIKLPDNFNVSIEEDCHIFVKGCIEITKPFNTAQVLWILNKTPLPVMEFEMDGCEIMESINLPIYRRLIKMLEFPQSCPVEKRTICHEQKSISIEDYKGNVAFGSGNFNMIMDISHDEVGRSCFNISAAITKRVS